MLLSRPAILKHLKDGNIVIDPFDDRKLKTASYDVAVGEWYYRERHPKGRISLHNPFDKNSTAQVWDGPYEAERASAISKRLGLKLDNIESNAKVILLEPRETILGHTLEFIGGRNRCISKLYARSSLGRNFIEVCKDAGWGDVGYFNRWTMEITNNSQFYTIPLVVGRRIGQMVFYEIEPLDSTRESYADEDGKYQTRGELADLKKKWKPEMMLPRMHLDWEVGERSGGR